MDSLIPLLDHWPLIAKASGALTGVRILWLGWGSIAVAVWERDQLRRQVRILETRVNQLEDIIDGPDHSVDSSGTSSAEPATIPTRIQQKRLSSSGSTD